MYCCGVSLEVLEIIMVVYFIVFEFCNFLVICVIVEFFCLIVI